MRNPEHHFFAALLGSLLVMLAVTGCRQEAPEDFDRHATEQLQAICEALRDGDAEAAYERVQAASTQLRESPLAAVLRDFHRKNGSLAEASRLLQNQEYDTLEALVSQAEADGLSSPELLRIRSVERALQAVEAYCARMPWEDSRTLAEALSWLDPHLETLGQSETFRRFRQGQLLELDRLRAEEKRRTTASVSAALEKCLAVSDFSGAIRQLSILKSAVPEHPLLAWLSETGQWQAPAIPDWPEDDDGRRALELAIAFALPQAPDALWREFKERLLGDDRPLTLPAMMLKALYSGELPDIQLAILTWLDRFPGLQPPSPLIEGAFRALGVQRLTEPGDNGWETLPGPLSLLNALDNWADRDTGEDDGGGDDLPDGPAG